MIESRQAKIEVQLLSRPGCHLCDQMKESLQKATEGLDVLLTVVDISLDDELASRFENDIPVVFVNGNKAFKQRATAKDLRRRLILEST